MAQYGGAQAHLPVVCNLSEVLVSSAANTFKAPKAVRFSRTRTACCLANASPNSFPSMTFGSVSTAAQA